MVLIWGKAVQTWKEKEPVLLAYTQRFQPKQMRNCPHLLPRPSPKMSLEQQSLGDKHPDPPDLDFKHHSLLAALGRNCLFEDQTGRGHVSQNVSIVHRTETSKEPGNQPEGVTSYRMGLNIKIRGGWVIT